MSETRRVEGPYEQITLPEFLSMVALREQARKRLFGSYQVPNVPFATQGLLLFWEGCILGRAEHESLDALIRTFAGSQALEAACRSLSLPVSQAHDPSWVKDYLSRVGPDGYRHFGGQPESLLDLFATSFVPPDFDFRDIETVRRLKKQRTPLETAIVQGSVWAIVGTSIGLTMPDE
ncbi:MAG: hypothetical protein IH863_08560, partial [Chloroflexi bacterium]|nr:hypothetical protein [Chloroflexota bacterium]